MSMKEIDSENANKYIEYIPNKATTTAMREKGIDKYANA